MAAPCLVGAVTFHYNPSMALNIHVGKVRRVPFTVKVSGIVDATTPVDVTTTQPTNLGVALDGLRTLKLRALAPTSAATAAVKVFPGTAFEQRFGIEVNCLAPAPPPVEVVFGEPSEETDD